MSKQTKLDWKYIISCVLFILLFILIYEYRLSIPPSVLLFFEGEFFKYGLLFVSIAVFITASHKKGKLVKSPETEEEERRWDITVLIGIFKESMEFTITIKLFISFISDIGFGGGYFPRFGIEEKYVLLAAILYLFANSTLKFLDALNCIFTKKITILT